MDIKTQSIMAEILGTAASVAALFKCCIEAFDLIQSVRHQEKDLANLVLKFNIEKCRLFMWGKVMGLTVQAKLAEGRLGEPRVTGGQIFVSF